MTAKELFCKGIHDVTHCEYTPAGHIVPCRMCCNYVACTMEIIAWDLACEGVL